MKWWCSKQCRHASRRGGQNAKRGTSPGALTCEMRNGVRPQFVLATSFLARMRGLLGTDPNWGGGNKVLALIPCKSVHTFGMQYSLDIAFVHKNGIVLQAYTDVPPNKRLSCKTAYFTLERPHSGNAWLNTGDKIPLMMINHSTTPFDKACSQSEFRTSQT